MNALAPLHQRIRGEIERRILAGEMQPGERIPYEHELMADYGCSRMTVSKALGALAEAGLIERRRGAGSFVCRPAALSAMLQVPDIRAEVAARGQHHSMELLSRVLRRADAADRIALGLRAGARVLAVECRHLANGQPYALEQRLLNLALVPQAAAQDFAEEPPGSWLLRHVPWSEAEHRIAALPAEGAVATALGLPPGTACLQLRRRTFRDTGTITAVTMTYPWQVHEVVARFRPGGTPGGGTVAPGLLQSPPYRETKG